MREGEGKIVKRKKGRHRMGKGKEKRREIRDKRGRDYMQDFYKSTIIST